MFEKEMKCNSDNFFKSVPSIYAKVKQRFLLFALNLKIFSIQKTFLWESVVGDKIINVNL